MECKRINDCFECKSESVKKGWIIKLQRSQNKRSAGEANKIYESVRKWVNANNVKIQVVGCKEWLGVGDRRIWFLGGIRWT